MPGKKNPEARKAEAVGLALITGTEAAAKALGVSQRSVQRWVDDPRMADLVAEKTEVVTDHLWAGVQIGLESVVKGLQSDEPLAARTTAFGVLFDKWSLLSGRATSRSETVGSSLPPEVQRGLRERFSELARVHASSEEPSVEAASEASPAAAEG
jgi:hypothetical protein